MTRAHDWIALVEAMSRDPRNCIVGSIFILGGFLTSFGFSGYALNHHNKAFYYIALLGVTVWILLLCFGWTIQPSMKCFSNGPTFLIFCFILVVYLGMVTLIAVALAGEYNREIKDNINVTDATLARFSLSSTTTTLDYNLMVKVIVGPNRKKHGVYYGSLQAWASYQGHNFTSLSLPPFYLGGKSNHTYNSSTVVLQPLVLQGSQAQLVLSPDGLKRYRQDEAAGRFSIDVTLSYTRLRGHHQLKRVDTFTLQELPLPNATSGWLDHTGTADDRTGVVACIIILSICTPLLLCCLTICVSSVKEDDTTWSAVCCICMLAPLILIALFIPILVGILKNPDQVKLSISNATLTQFNFPYATINNTLAYNLSLAITIGPNKEKTGGVYLEKMEAVAYYQGQNFTSLPLSALYLQGQQKHGSRTIILHHVLQGQQVLVLTSDGLKHYQKETTSRRYNILVTLSYSGIRTDDAYNPGSAANGTSTMPGKLKGVAYFDLRVPLLADPSQ